MGEPSAGESAERGGLIDPGASAADAAGLAAGADAHAPGAFLRPAVARRRPLGTSPPLMSTKRAATRTNWRERAKPPPHPSRVKKTRAGDNPRGGRATGRIDESSTY